jgi:hypothetical protein
LTPIYGGAVKSASRTAAVKNSAELEIVDEIESADSVEMSEHFCTPAAVKIIDDSTVELSQGGKTLLVKMESAFLHKAQIYKPEKLLESDVELSPTDGNFFSFELAVPANTKAAYTIIMREK